MKKIILAISTLAILAGPALGITYRRPVTSHSQLTSTGTLTHASLESTLTAVNDATATLKGITDAHAATLAQVQTDTGTISGMLAFDSAGNATKSTTYDGSNVLTMKNPISCSLSDGEYAMIFDGAFSGIQYLGNTNGIRISAALSGVPYSARPIELNASCVRVCNVSTMTSGGAAIFAGSVTANGGFYGDGSNLTGVIDADCRASTGTLLSMFASVGDSTDTFRTDLTAVKQSTGAVCYESHFIVYGNTQTFVTNLSTQPASPMQSAPLGAFTISSATARVIDGTSATIRLFITDKSNEYSVTAATPIWSSAVTAGTSRTGGTLANVVVGVDNRIMAVIDAIDGAVKYLDIAVRGTR